MDGGIMMKVEALEAGVFVQSVQMKVLKPWKIMTKDIKTHKVFEDILKINIQIVPFFFFFFNVLQNKSTFSNIADFFLFSF